jgi:hypothetical protein
VIEEYVAAAEAFVPRGRRPALATNETWPKKLERASVEYFEIGVGARIHL